MATYSNKELIKRHKKTIEILRNDLLTYGKTNRTVAKYDQKEIAESEIALDRLEKEEKTAKILDTKFLQQLKLIKYNDSLYTIDFDGADIGYTLVTDTTLKGIKEKWEELKYIIIELVELDMDYKKEDLKEELERIHGDLIVDFKTLYSIRKSFV